MFYSWGKLREFAHISVIWARPHVSVPAATDGERRTWADPDLSQREHWCAVGHELVHIEQGHRGCQPGPIEHELHCQTPPQTA